MTGPRNFTTALRRGVQQDLVNVVQALEDYRAQWQEYPRELSTLTQGALALKAVNLTGRSPGFLALPRRYQYVRSADGRTYDLFGVGRDRRAGTPDDARPVLPDSLASRSGYRPSR